MATGKLTYQPIKIPAMNGINKRMKGAIFQICIGLG